MEATLLLAKELAQVDRRYSGMVVAYDHDPSFTKDDEAELDRLLERSRTLGVELAQRFAALAGDPSWQAFVVDGERRLRALESSDHGNRFAAGDALYGWSQLTPSRFAKGIAVLIENRDAIDALIRSASAGP